MDRVSRDIYILGAVRTLRSFSFGYVAFLLPLYLKHVGFSYEMIGLYTLIATISSAVLTLVSGWLGDLYSRRKALAIMSLLPAGTYAAVLLTKNHAVLMASAAFGLTMSPMGGGSGGGPVAPLQTAMVASRVSQEARTRIYSYLMMAAIVSALAGSAFSGTVMRLSQAYYLELFMIALLITVSTAALVLLVSEEPDRSQRPSSAVPRRSARNIGKVSLAGLFGSLGLGMVMSLLPVYFKELGANDFQVSLIYDASYAAAAVGALIAPLAEKAMGPVRSILILRGLGSALLAAIPLSRPLALAGAIYALRTGLYQAALPIRQNVSMELYDPSERSRGLSITGVFRRLPYGAAAAVGSVLFQVGAFVVVFSAAAGISLLDPVLYYAFFSYFDRRGKAFKARAER